MFSYVFMKILENRPERYDAGIQILSGGHAKKIKEKIVRDYIKPGMDVLDAGCGTGSLLLEIANAGANATGVDISQGMLDVAQKRIAGQGLQDAIKIVNAGITELDSLFAENSFDVIISTLVFSELYAEERTLALHQIHKLLRKNGTLVIAVEVQPRRILKRILHFLLRLPLSIITYLVAQTGTKAVKRLTEEIQAFGFEVAAEDRSFLDSFSVISAQKLDEQDAGRVTLPAAKMPGDDVYILKSIWDFIGRWFPNPIEPGLRAIGKPDRHSPVILTCNFHLTVRRVEKSLQGENVWLLAAPSNGINVWCASCGGEMNTHSIITAIKTSRIKERIDHHHLILPQFSAPGVDFGLLEKETGIKGVFGPAYSKDIPEYLQNHRSVLQHNRVKFALPFRLEMLASMNFLMWLAFAVIAVFIAPKLFLQFSALFWTAGLILYAGYPIIPGKSGWLKAGVFSAIEITAIALLSIFFFKTPAFHYWGLMASALAINLWLGFDLRGIVAGDSSEAEWLMHKLNAKSLGHLFVAEALNVGRIQQDIDKCNDCEICLRICPKGVYAIAGKSNVRIQQQSKCFACNACVVQCPQDALALR